MSAKPVSSIGRIVACGTVIPLVMGGCPAQVPEPPAQPGPKVLVISEDPTPDAAGRVIISPAAIPVDQGAPQPGWGLVTGDGMRLYRMDAVQVMPDGSLEVTISQASLSELGVEGVFQFAHPLDSVQAAKLGRQDLAANAEYQILDVTMPFSKRVNLTNDGSVTAMVDGRFDLDGTFHLAFDVGELSGLRTFSSSVEGTSSFRLHANVTAQRDANVSGEQPVTSRLTIPFDGVIPTVPPIPIRIVVAAQLFLGFEGRVTANASADAGVNAGAQVEVGARYNSSAANRWSTISQAGFNWGYDEPTLCYNGSGSLRVYLRPHFEVQLWGLVGPTFDIEPYGKLDANIQGCLGNPLIPFDVVLTAGAIGYAKIKADILDRFVIESPRLTVFDVSRELKRWHNAPAAPRYLLTLLPSPSGSGSITADPTPVNGTYAAGTVVQVTANPTSGYQFGSWSGDVAGTVNPQSVTMNGNKSITANFAVAPIDRYSLTLSSSPSNGGTITADPLPVNGTYAAGTVVQLTANPASGYQFGSWSGDITGTTNPKSVTLTANRSVTAQFSQTQTPTAPAPTISPNGGTYIGSTQVTMACSDSLATIRYTTNGNTPTGGSTAYGGPFTLTSSATVKARAFRSGYNDSNVASATFTIDPPPQPPVCTVVPTFHDFGTVPIGSSTDRTFTITNTGGGTLSGSVSGSCGQYSIVSGAGSYSLGAGQSHTLTVRFSPNSAGTKTCTITLSGGCASVTCTGIGVGLPTVTLVGPAEVTQTSAAFAGNVGSSGGTSVIERGFCWYTSSNPTINNNRLPAGSGTGTFSGTLAGLSSGTHYYVRAYATSSAGTAYSNQVDFRTMAEIFSEGFEGAFPGSWYVGNNNSNTVARWGDNRNGSYRGSRSAFCADNGSDTRATYDNNLNTYMQRRSISLSGYSNATLTFAYWMNIEGHSSCSFDRFEVNVRNQSGTWSNLMTICGNQSGAGWQVRTVNMNAYAGQTGLIISFDFVSDGSVVPSSPAGVWLDEVKLTARN